MVKTLDMKPGERELIKPGEIIDVREITPLTLQDRRVYNLLIDNAWDSLGEKKMHRVAKRFLRGSHNVNDRLDGSFIRLMGAVVERAVIDEDEPAVLRFSLLGDNCEHNRPDGIFKYTFPEGIRSLFRESEIFARLRRDVVLAFRSKYSLSLYEVVAKRINLKYVTSEHFELSVLRGVLGVPKKKLREWYDLERRVLRPACLEVTEVADFRVTYSAIKRGRSVAAVELRWVRK